MDHFAGLDVSVKETSICIVDDTGKIVREVKVPSEPEALLAVLKNPAYNFKRIGLEAGPLSQWLFGALAEAELPVVCVETRQMLVVGCSSRSASSRFGTISTFNVITPVRLPPGRLRLATSPTSTGSVPSMKTIGIAEEAAFAANAAEVALPVAITFALWLTRSVANAGNSS